MYVTTFYSFKGGVGRTMALVNSAVSLALRGRRVLAVDFDIEAPGLDTFEVLRPDKKRPGIVDFVVQYLESGRAPSVAEFVSECPAIGDQGGKLWVMSSGQEETYAANFNHVNWGELYDKHDGYLLFEELKAQWNKILRPDYVLIDSRTGHTDTSGICTRQLPDSVVILFFPNEQNLRGLTEVVSDIRSEGNEPRNKNIELHFVMSNVPELDDEDRILESKKREFQRHLNFRDEPVTVHRYDSLSLLNQAVFTKDRPRSRLAKEYEDIVRAVTAQNFNDRDGALDFIRRERGRWRRTQKREAMLKDIENAHADDGEILFRLAELKEADGQREDAVLLASQAIEAGYDEPSAFLKRAQLLEICGDLGGASQDSRRLLAFNKISPPTAREAIRRLERREGYSPKNIVDSAAISSLELDDKVWLASTFNRSQNDLRIAVSLLERILETGELPARTRSDVKHYLGLAYLGLGRCSEAEIMFLSKEQNLGDLNIANAFNLGMARWGAPGTIDVDVFQRVVALDRSNNQKAKPLNYLQCMAIAYWAVGETSTAIDYVHETNLALNNFRGSELSCWRYLHVSAGAFNEDLDEIRALIDGDTMAVPKFIKCRLGG